MTTCFQFCLRFAFQFNLRRYTVALSGDGARVAYQVGRCRLTL